MTMAQIYDILIVGGGPAGLTAATYARRAGKTVLVIEKGAFGGQITWSPRVENFPGVISAGGNEIGDMLLSQAMEQGADVELEEIVSAEKCGDLFSLRALSGTEYRGRSLIAAAGAKPAPLGLAREEELTGSGVCYCAVCDGAFFAGQDVAVCGGGNSALQDALLLSEKCRKVYLVHRRSSFRGEEKLVEALKAKENVEFMLEASVTALLGGDTLEAAELSHNGEKRIIPISGLFVAIGHVPQNGIFAGLMELDEKGYAAAGENCLTRTPGFFAAGDCRQKRVRQCATACADGAVAALAACEYLR